MRSIFLCSRLLVFAIFVLPTAETVANQESCGLSLEELQSLLPYRNGVLRSGMDYLREMTPRIEKALNDVREASVLYHDEKTRGLPPIAQAYSELVKLLIEYRSYRDQINSLSIEEQSEYDEVLDQQISLIETKARTIKDLLAKQFLPTSDAVVLELTHGGGKKSIDQGYYAEELLKMYETYAKQKGWKFEILSAERTDSGLMNATVSIKGTDVGRSLQHEVGYHRVEHRSTTMDRGNIYTSRFRVNVLPEGEQTVLQFPDADFEVQTMRSGGPGGQNVNKLETAVRVTHRESGETVTISTSRHQKKNKETAFRILRARLRQQATAQLEQERQAQRREQTTITETSGRVRTYDFVRGEVQDDRSKYRETLSSLMKEGNLDNMIESVEQLRLAEILRAE